MDVTVAICTRNRCESLRRTLRSLVAARRPVGLVWEVVVVNNDSNDQSDSVIGSFRDVLPIVPAFEPIAGHSNARNTAVRLARGRYIIWTDDDVVVDPGWLSAYSEAFDAHPEAALFGGPIRPVFEGEMPKWLARGWRSVAVVFCENDLGPNAVALSGAPGMVPFGANFAIRRKEQLALPYDPKLGLSPTGRFMTEETTVMRQLLHGGAVGWWVPNASVTHCNSQERFNLRYIQRYFEKLGRTQWIQRSPMPETLFLGRPRWLWRQLLVNEIQYWFSRAFDHPENWLGRLRERSIVWGAFKECAVNPPPRSARHA